WILQNTVSVKNDLNIYGGELLSYGNLYIYTDSDYDGIGRLNQISGIIHAAGELYIYSAGNVQLNTNIAGSYFEVRANHTSEDSITLTGDIQAASINLCANSGIRVNKDISLSSSLAISINADYDENGTGSFIQASGTTFTVPTSSQLYMYSAGNIVLENMDLPLVWTWIYANRTPNDTITVNGELNVSGNIYLYANNGITINNNIVMSAQDINLFSDSDSNGTGIFQNTGTLTVINGNLIIYSSGNALFNNLNFQGITLIIHAPAFIVTGDLTLGTSVTYIQIPTVIFSPVGTKTLSDNTLFGQNLGVVKVEGGLFTPKLNLVGNVKVLSLFIDSDHTVVMTANSSLKLTGSGTPLTGEGILDTYTYTPNTIQYSGTNTRSITSAGPVSAYYNLVLNITGSAGEMTTDTIIADPDVVGIRSAVIDTVHGYAYFGTDNSPGKIIKVRLSDFTIVGVLTAAPGEDYFESAVIDPARGYAYFGTMNSPAKVVRINLADFSYAGSITLTGGESSLRCAVIDLAGGYAYFGADTWPGTIAKINIDPDNFSQVATLTTYDYSSAFYTAVIDTVHGYAYFGAFCQGRIVKIDLTNFTQVSTLELPIWEYPDMVYVVASMIDPTNNYAYFTTSGYNVGRIAKIDLTSFSMVDLLSVSTNLYGINSAVIDPTSGYAYLGVYSEPGRILKLDLENFVIVNDITLNPDENWVWSGVIDPENGYAYFAPYWPFPAKIVRVDIKSQGGIARLGDATGQTLVINGDLTIQNCSVDADTFDPTIILKGNLIINGENATFNTGTSSVIFEDASKVSTVFGSHTFNNFICVTPGKQIKFEADSTQIILGTLTLTGAAGNRIILRSTLDGVQWNIDPRGPTEVSFVDIKDSNNLNSDNIIKALDSVDSGNNTNWSFGEVLL
ncbi:MAG: ABC transporter permease, partial [Halobacteria archaeon]